MSSLLRPDLCFFILQFLYDEKLLETAHKFEEESGVFFNLSYFEKLVMDGRWAEADSYLAGFTAIGDNSFSSKAFFEIRKQNYLEALDRNEKVKAVEILSRDLKIFESTHQNLYKELAYLLALDNFREYEELADYGDANSVRAVKVREIKILVENNPLLCNKLQFPNLKPMSLLSFLIQSCVNQQCHQCKVPLGISLSYLDHSCEQSQSQSQLSGPRVAAPVSAFDGVSQLAQGFQQPSIGRTLEDAPIRTFSPQLGPSNSAAHFNCPLSPRNDDATKDHFSSDHEYAVNRICIVGPSVEQNGDTLSMVVDVEDIIKGMPIENSKSWKVHEINEPSQCCSLSLPESLVSVKVPGLAYMNSGTALLALGSNGVHKLWRWPEMANNETGQATTSLPPALWKPPNAENLTNDLSNLYRGDSDHFFVVSKNDSYILSTSGGKISLFNMLTFKTIFTFMPPTPVATCIAFYPQDNNIIALGMRDGSIHIYNIGVVEVKTKLKGRRGRITGLAFSSSLNVLVSACLDDRLCIWATDSWMRKASKRFEKPNRPEILSHIEIRVQFHNDLVHFLVVHGSQLAIYEAKKLKRSKQWISPAEGVITNAAYSCDGEMIYATFMDGSLSVFTAALQLRCRINPTAYPSARSSLDVYPLDVAAHPSKPNQFALELTLGDSLDVYPLVVAAHPSKPNQFALGLTNGDIYVFEPLEAEGKWGTPPPEGDSL